ncbi:MAG: hypothetical protein HY609_04265 [Deltaproteobacteria bacterium]|nr:hypothetical protein [Deltaproteobacteria bacterium]MBI4224124.1 hypothetical protein [Deltaproteobacteria bacterium]
MMQIKKTSRFAAVDKPSRKSIAKTDESSGQAASPFAIKPPDALRAITERKSRQLKEWQKLAILQRALEPYASEAKEHLPPDLRQVEEKVRQRMLEEGFKEEIAAEAGDETVSAILDTRSKQKQHS